MRAEQTDELDRLVAAGEISDADRERVRFIVRAIVDHPSGLMIHCPRRRFEGLSSYSTPALHDLVPYRELSLPSVTLN
jgi:hypothetical protein